MRISSRALRTCAAVTIASVATAGVVAPAQAATAGPKNVIYMIGDGMGYNHIASTNLYESGQSKYLVEGKFDGEVKEIDGESVQAFEDFNRVSMTTFPEGGSYDPAKAWTDHDYVKQDKVTDSAAAGTAMATGQKVDNGVLGKSSYGHSLKNISEQAISHGKSAGVVSSVPFSHATPAAFAAHNKNRNNYKEIAAEMVGSDLSVIMGAGHPEFDDNAQKVDAPNYKYLSEESFNSLRDGSAGWEFAENTADFEKWAEGNVEADKKYFGLAPVASTLQQGRDGNPEAAEPGTDPKNDVVDLPTMTKGALNVLGQNDKGFSVMIEGGAIDWSGHANQTGRDIEETQDFNKAVDAAIAWVEENSNWDETLLIVTADHETGYLSGKDETESWNPQTGEEGKAPQHQWYSGEHTNQVVPFFFKGAGSEDILAKATGEDPVRGKYIDNTDVANLIIQDWWFANDSKPEDQNKPEDQDNAGKTPEDDANKDDSKDEGKDNSKGDSNKGNAGKKDTSSATGAGFLGAGVAAAILGAIAAFLQSIGAVKVDFSALQRLLP
ncbi:alkaline phosphatase [Corynebacterium sp. BF-R-2]|uniref:alkaline phosphatase n=1 Tax=Corynebacterium sp. BF-R-2 TaxID=2943494 RepID=UPI00211F20EB|nr:alkaline phosphatase [Corynebacterium sp. BF-R-2]MCQ9676972.1 alkaline phosphatase [Corynebacterium sp. BF-R-2]